MLSLPLSQLDIPRHKYLMTNYVEARGVEPLSSKRSTQTSTSLPDVKFKGAKLPPGPRPPPERQQNSFQNPAGSPRRFARLFPPFPPLAGVAAETSRSIKPRERDL